MLVLLFFSGFWIGLVKFGITRVEQFSFPAGIISLYYQWIRSRGTESQNVLGWRSSSPAPDPPGPPQEPKGLRIPRVTPGSPQGSQGLRTPIPCPEGEVQKCQSLGWEGLQGIPLDLVLAAIRVSKPSALQCALGALGEDAQGRIGEPSGLQRQFCRRCSSLSGLRLNFSAIIGHANETKDVLARHWGRNGRGGGALHQHSLFYINKPSSACLSVKHPPPDIRNVSMCLT